MFCLVASEVPHSVRLRGAATIILLKFPVRLGNTCIEFFIIRTHALKRIHILFSCQCCHFCLISNEIVLFLQLINAGNVGCIISTAHVYEWKKDDDKNLDFSSEKIDIAQSSCFLEMCNATNVLQTDGQDQFIVVQ